MNAQHLAEAVVHWLELERLCGRDSLFTEASLKLPVHQYLTAAEPFDVALEEELPGIPAGLKSSKTGRKKSLDFCLRRSKRKSEEGKGVLVDVLESKFVTTKRHFAQEVLNDLFRLQWLKPVNQSEPCKRWVLLAGLNSDLNKQVLQKGGTKKKPTVDQALYGVLHRQLRKLWAVAVAESAPKQRKRWLKAADQLMAKKLPPKLKTKLEGKFPSSPFLEGEYVCLIWRILEPKDS